MKKVFGKTFEFFNDFTVKTCVLIVLSWGATMIMLEIIKKHMGWE